MSLVSWPDSYLMFLEELDFVNVNIFRYLGLSCIGVTDHQVRIIIICTVPAFIVIIQCIAYRISIKYVKQLKESSKTYTAVRLNVLNYLYSIMDRDNNGDVDADEFKTLVQDLYRKTKPWKQRQQHVDDFSLQLMMKLGGQVQNRKTSIQKSVFLKYAVTHSKPQDMFSHHRICQLEKKRQRGNYISFTLVWLFILHAPVSNRLFRYFNCHDLSAGLIKQRFYLKSDYTVQCKTPEYFLFSYGFVVPFLVLFTFMLPFVISMLLCR